MSSDEALPGGVIEDLRRAMTPRGRSQLGGFTIEGLRLHERALRSGARIETAVVADSLQRRPAGRVERLLAGLDAAGCRVHVAPDEQVAMLTEGRSIGAIVGLVAFPPARPLGEVLSHVAEPPAVAVVAVEVEDPGNVGALVRTSLASGVAAFVAVGISDPYHPRAVRTSMGSLFKLPILRYPRLGPLLDDLDSAGAHKFGAVASGGAVPQDQSFDASGIAVFLGSEAFGLSATARERMDRLLTVPMRSGVDSFSVNAVAAILLYEIRRRGKATQPARGRSGC